MAKKIKFESFKYRFLIAAQNAKFFSNNSNQMPWHHFVSGLVFKYSSGVVDILWGNEKLLNVSLSDASFYLRGDSKQHIDFQHESGFMGCEDPVKIKNDAYFKALVNQVAQASGFLPGSSVSSVSDQDRFSKEQAFHDAWAESENVETIDVLSSNQVCTAPEMRFITKRLGDIRGKKLLDVGCGLGEASVYFALLGANVTASDLSPGMLKTTCKLADTNNVKVTPHVSAAEDLRLPADALFDIIYAGNLLHHVDIDKTLARIKAHLAPGGVVVTWDPLAYNPIINVYRKIASDVRTPDEHPLTWNDIKLFKKHFEVVETNYFWLSTLIIFLIMALLQRRNPNKERFWKVVVQEGDKWQWLYSPLEKMDRFLIAIFPPLRLLCWNIVVVSSNPNQSKGL
jgi:SAM-dependent methyltransferase